jgi:hypothetical protein
MPLNGGRSRHSAGARRVRCASKPYAGHDSLTSSGFGPFRFFFGGAGRRRSTNSSVDEPRTSRGRFSCHAQAPKAVPAPSESNATMNAMRATRRRRP